jgi:lysophospholipase L1-like esterase
MRGNVDRQATYGTAALRGRFWQIGALAIIAVLALSAHDTKAADPKSPIKKPSYRSLRLGMFDLAQIDSANIVMLGDSLTERAQWSEITGCPFVANRGIGGDESPGVLRRLDGIIKLHPSAVFLMIGINDVLSDVPINTIAANVQQTIDTLTKADAHVYLTMVLPVTRKVRSSINSKVGELNATYRKLADRTNVSLVDFRGEMSTPDGALRDELSIDGVHLSPEGYRVWRDAIVPLVDTHCQRKAIPPAGVLPNLAVKANAQ